MGIALSSGKTYTSIRTYELLLDSYDRERNGLARRPLRSHRNTLGNTEPNFHARSQHRPGNGKKRD